MTIIVRASFLVMVAVVFTSCASKSVFVQRKDEPAINLHGLKTVEIRHISGGDSKGFALSLSEYLTKHSPLTVVTSQGTRELVNSIFRGEDRTKENYPQADLIIKGEYQEERHPVTSEDGSMVYDIIVRTRLELIRSTTGEVLNSDYYVGTARSGVIIKDRFYSDHNPLYEGVNEARRRAFYYFTEKFSPSPVSVELRLWDTNDSDREKLVKLIKMNQFDKAREICKKRIDATDSKVRASGLYNLAIIEIVQGNYAQSKNLVESAYTADNNPDYLKLMDTISYIEGQPN